MTGIPEAYGHAKTSDGEKEREVPAIGVDYTCTRGEQEKESKKVMPISDSETNMIVANVRRARVPEFTRSER